MQLTNPFTRPGQFYKANLHTHTTNSDGEKTASERARQYKEHGYSVLAVTDHHLITDIGGLSDDDFLLISSMETHPACLPDTDVYHLVCLNVPKDLQLPEDSTANERVRMVKAAGGELIFAHPYWCGHNINHITAVEDFIAVEVYNATCTKIGKGISSVQWDDILDAGRIVGAVAVDDTHSGRDLFMGWTMIKATELTVESIMTALRSGSYYCSCGPTIEDFRVENGVATVECSPATEVHLMGRRASGLSYYADGGELITSASRNADPSTGYVRAEVVDEKGRRAWTNPIILAEY